ncbi:septum formation family protein [Nocardioides sp.]|uniref:septum formation family protein n=1 Tax=Nocardioides sp. TaxID=35761 RepID=UPI002ED388BB
MDVRTLAVLLTTLLLLTGCTEKQGTNVDPDQVDAVAAPGNGVCRVLTPADLEMPSNATRTVACSEPHTAQTFAVGELPEDFTDTSYDDPELGAFAYRTCGTRFQEYLGGDESLVMRSIASWAWFRPSEKAWDDGARWYRCDVVGGGADSEELRDLPTDAEGLLTGRLDDDWMVCADGPTVAGAQRVACSEPHTWRAVTTIKLGEPEDPYPGDRQVEVRSRDFCDKSVAAVLDYPVTYDFAYTWFHEAEWEVGNRRSICWAKTRR